MASDEARVKRALFRASHRGMQETDLLLGGFAKHHLAHFSDDQLARFEALLEEGDNDLFDWITGRQPVPAAHDDELMKLLQDFNKTVVNH